MKLTPRDQDKSLADLLHQGILESQVPLQRDPKNMGLLDAVKVNDLRKEGLDLKGEPVLGRNAWQVAKHFVLGLALVWVLSWLLYKPLYDFMGSIIDPLFQ